VTPDVSSFTFAFAGDFSHYQRFQANMDSLNQSSAAFFLALGDLAYGPNVTTVEQSWCSEFKASFDNVEIVTGNHDSGENTYGSIQKYVQYCPWTLSGITVVPGVKQGYGYGYEYYFDYPAVNPLARFIMISPGINFTTAQAGFSEVWKYNAGDQHYNWTSDTIDSARAVGIPWVIVGMHKPCLVIATNSDCSSGASIMSLLLLKKVDLVINGHMHMYARSKQLSCATYGLFSPGCVVDDRNFLAKGAGTVIVTSGTGGQNPLDNIDPAKTENMKYFAAENNDTTGYSEVKVLAGNLQMQFIPTTGAFTDSFTIQQPPSDFSMSIPPSLNITTHQNVPYPAHVTVAGWNGFTGNVAITSSIRPSAGLEVDCNPAAVELSPGLPIAYSACDISASNVGSYVVNITGTSGPLSHSAMVSVTAGSTPPDFTILARPSVSFNANTSYTSAIRVQSKNFFISPIELSSSVAPGTGLNVSLSVNTILYGSGISIATLTSSTAGTYTVTVSATSGPITHVTSMTIQVTKTGVGGDYAETVVPALIVVQPIQNGTSTVHLASLNGFHGNVSLSALVFDNCIPGPCFNGPFAPHAFLDRTRVSLASGTIAQSTLTIQAPSIPYSKPVNFSVEIVVSNGTLFHSIGPTVSVEPNPDFTVTTPALVTFLFGETGSTTVDFAGQYGFTSTVKLAVLVAPPTGLDATCAPAMIQKGTGSSNCIILSSTPGSYVLTAMGTSGETTHSAGAIVTVAKRSTSTSVLCSPSTVALNQDSTCIATVSDVSPGSANTPTGTVSFTSSGVAGVFSATNCSLVTGSCSVTFTPSATGMANIDGNYSGDSTHSESIATKNSTLDARQASTSLLLPFIAYGTMGGLVLIDIFLVVVRRAGKKPLQPRQALDMDSWLTIALAF